MKTKIVLALLGLLVCITGQIIGQTIDRSYSTTNGIVNSTVQSGNSLYLGGNFTQVGLGFKSFARYSPGNNRPDANFPQVTGILNAIEPDGNGGYYLGGNLSNFNGRSLLDAQLNTVITMHINADYTIDTNFLLARDPIGSGTVTSLKKQGSRLYLGGYFYTVNNTSRPYLAALDPVTGALLSWTPPIDINNDYVNKIDANDTLVFASGSFDFYNSSYYGSFGSKTLKAFRADDGTDVSSYPSSNVNSASGGSISIKNNRLYYCNNNSNFGQLVFGAAKVNASTAAADISFPYIDGIVYSILPDGSGGYYIGGDFYKIGNTIKRSIAHLLSGGILDAAFTANVNGPVDCLASDGTNLYIGGSFSQVNSTARSNAAAVNLTTGALAAWNPAPNNEVLTMLYSGGAIYMGGYFNSVKATTRNYAAAVTAANNLTAWNPNCDNPVRQIIANQNGSSFFIAGDFTIIKGTGKSHLAKVNNTDGTPSSWNPSPNGYVQTALLDGNILYIGGGFSAVNGISRQNIAAIDTASNNPTSFTANANNAVYNLNILNGKLYVGGFFTQIQNISRNHVARIDLTTNTADGWDPSLNSTVNAIAGNGTEIICGGEFTLANVVSRNLFAAIDINSKQVTSFNPVITNSSGTVKQFYFSGNELFAVGNFTYNDGGSFAKLNIICLDTTTGNITRSFDKYPNSSLNAISIFDNKIMLGGSFTSFSNPNGSGPVTKNNLAAYDLNTNMLSPDIYDPNSAVNALQTDAAGGLIATGSFTLTNYVSRTSLAAIDLSTGLPNSFNATTDGTVNTIALKDSTLFIGGSFSRINAQTRSNIGAVNTNTSATTGWTANANGIITAMALNDSTLYISGSFTNIKSTNRNRAAALTTGAATVTSWNPNLNNSGKAILLNGSNIYLGGSFTTVGGIARNYLAKVDNVNGALASWNPNPNAIVNSLTKDTAALYAGGSFSSISGKSIYSVAKFSLAADTIFSAFDPRLRFSSGAPTVNALSLWGGTLFTGSGNINKVNGVNKGVFVGVNTFTDSATAFDPQPNAQVLHSNIGANKLFAGGSWTGIDGKLSPSYFAIFNLEPLTQTSNLSFTNLQPTGVTANWTKGSGEGRIVIVKEGSAAALPLDGTSYNPNNTFGQGSNISGSYVVYKNSGNGVNVTNLRPNHTYYFAVYEYNGTGAATEYLQSPSLTGSITTPCPTYTNIVSPAGPLAFCQGDSATLTAIAGMSTYAWSNGATTRSIVVKTAATYTVTITDSNGCGATSNPVAVTVNANPTPTTTPSGTVNIVSPNTVTISVNGTYSSYLWSTGATTSSITTGVAGSYTVTVTNASGCSGTSPAVVVNVSSCSKPTITASGSTSNVCPGQTVTLTSSAATSYLWSTGATTQSIVVSKAGSYTVTTGTGCTSDATVVTYQACAAPGSPTTSNITATSARVSWTAVPCAVGYQYQWRKKGTTAWTSATTTGTNKTISGLTAATTYQWRVITGCKITPDTIASSYVSGPEFTTLAAATVPTVSIKQQMSNSGSLTAKLFPNPAHDYATLQLSGNIRNATIRLTDMAGKTLWETRNVNSNQLQIPVSRLSNGTYLVSITSGVESNVLKLVKE